MTAGTSPGSAGSQPGMTIWTLRPNGGQFSGPVARCAGLARFPVPPAAPVPVAGPALVPALAPAGRKAVGVPAPHPEASRTPVMTRPAVARPVVSSLSVARRVASGLWVARRVASGLWVGRRGVTRLGVGLPVVTSLEVAGAGLAGDGLARGGLARSGLVSGLVLIFLAVARLVAVAYLASRPARATTRGGHVQARCGSSRMRCLPIAGPAYGENSTNTDLTGKAVIGMKTCG